MTLKQLDRANYLAKTLKMYKHILNAVLQENGEVNTSMGIRLVVGTEEFGDVRLLMQTNVVRSVVVDIQSTITEMQSELDNL